MLLCLEQDNTIRSGAFKEAALDLRICRNCFGALAGMEASAGSCARA